MRFGFFDQVPRAEGQSERQRYQDILAQIELGDQLGFQTAWLGELHFIPSISCLASPLMILAAAAQRTQRIRLGTAVTLLPLHNPVKMAEDAATLDVLSGGRLEFGVGRGAAPVYFSGYNVPQQETRERFEESLGIILRAWTSERLSYHGKYWQIDDLLLTPRPLQNPHPPIRVAANSPETFATAGREGFPIFASPLINPPDKLQEYLAVHRENLKPGVTQDIALAFPVHVAASRAQARRECEESLMSFFKAAKWKNRRITSPAAPPHQQQTRIWNSTPQPSIVRSKVSTPRSGRTRVGVIPTSRAFIGSGPATNARCPISWR